MKVIAYDQAGKEAGTRDLNVAEPKASAAHQVKLLYTATLANRRSDSAKTKKRDEVSGGGKKPWRQKGTGRARQGSIRSPQWVGGGIVFGPTGEQNHRIEMNKKEKAQALSAALYAKLPGQQVIAVESLEFTKTKDAAGWLAAVKAGKRKLIVADASAKNLRKAFRNISGVEFAEPTSLSVRELVDADTVVFLGDAMNIVEKRVGAAK